MPYTLLIVEDPQQRNTRTDAEGQAVYDRMVQYAGRLNAQWCTVAVREVGPCFT